MTLVGQSEISRGRLYAVCLAACVVIGLALRAIAGSGDAWLDEIWSWQIARSGEVLVAHDNNHLLNTLWLWIWRDVPVAFLWRLPAILAGGASVVMTAVLLRRLGRVHAITGALLIATSWPIVLYQSEARGYGLMLLCMLAAIELQLRLLEATSPRTLRIGLATVALAGALAHLSFALVYVLIVIAGLAMRRRQDARSAIRTTLFDHGLGMLGVAMWLGSFGRQMDIGGGPELDSANVLAQTLQSIGGLAWITPLIVLACITTLFRTQSRLIGTLAIVAIGYPILICLLKDRLLYVRYFLPMITAATLLLGAGIGELLTMPRLRVVGASLHILLTCLHLSSLLPLLSSGRDQHATALARIAMGQPRGTTIASDCDFQLRTILAYHEHAFASCSKPIVLHPTAASRWWIVMKPVGPDQLLHAGVPYTLRAS